MKTEVFNAALAGLLHNIGTFAQRAGEDVVISEIVPAPWVNAVQTLTTLEAHGELIDLARRLAAGGLPDEGQVSARQLQAIFCSITGLRDKNGQPLTPPKTQYVPLKKLAIASDTIFPSDAVADPTGDYQALWRGFKAEAVQLKAATEQSGADLEAYLPALLDLMQQYTWCVPADVDVSLYDHSRMTAALAASLAALPTLPKADSDEPVALLVGGDISGVQKFIYTITSKGAAKSLRGRSFYLQLLTEVVARYVLNRLDLPLTNLIYAGGGNFFLLAGVEHQEKLSAVARDVTKTLLATHDGSLHLMMAFQPITAKGLAGFTFHTAWNNLHITLNRAKSQPLSSLDNEHFATEVGAAQGVGGDVNALCRVCGRETHQTEAVDSGGETIRICHLCQSLADLGNQLAKATHLVFAFGAPRRHAKINRWWQGLELFGANMWPINANSPLKPGERYLKGQLTGLHLVDVYPLAVQAKHEAILLDEVEQIAAVKMRSTRLFAQLVAKGRDGFPLTFDELAVNQTDPDGMPSPLSAEPPDSAVRWSGLRRWGVLRMDVDNLGHLFRQGFINQNGDNTLTLGRVAGLSFALRLFFEGWLPQLGRQTTMSARLINRLYVQYAGGDDLFVVGSWDALPEFAAVIRASLAEYVGHNPAISLSGGVSLAPEKYPLYQAAGEAEQAEKLAKHYRPGKNAFCFLGCPVGWEEFEPVMTLAYELAAWCGEQELVSRALLQTLLAIYVEYEDGRNKAINLGKWQPGQLYYGPWRWHLAYQLGQRLQEVDRRINRPDVPAELRRQLENVQSRLKQIERDMLEQRKIETIGLAVRWAQYLIRQ